LFRQARAEAGLPKELVLYLCASRLWHQDPESNRKPSSYNEDNETS
jgi:hypothetical protein